MATQRAAIRAAILGAVQAGIVDIPSSDAMEVEYDPDSDLPTILVVTRDEEVGVFGLQGVQQYSLTVEVIGYVVGTPADIQNTMDTLAARIEDAIPVRIDNAAPVLERIEADIQHREVTVGRITLRYQVLYS